MLEGEVSAMHEQVIRTLNEFLRGRYMGIHQYGHLIRNTKDERLKQQLQRYQEHAEIGAKKIAKRIEELGGEPVDGVGLMGKFQEWMQQLKGYPEDTEEILQQAYIGENKYGIHLSHRMVAGELDPESKHLVDDILEEDQKRVNQIKQQLTVPMK